MNINCKHLIDQCITTESAPLDCTKDSKAANYLLKVAPHPSRPGRCLLQIWQGDRKWRIPAAWTQSEALRLLAKKQQLEALDIDISCSPPRVEALHSEIVSLWAEVTGEPLGFKEVAA